MSDYVTDLEKKLQSARRRVKQGNEIAILKKSAPTLFEIMDTEISFAVNKMTADKPLSHEEYLDYHGRVRGIMSIRDLLNSKQVEAAQASQEAQSIDEQLKQFKNEKKQK